ncbi:ComEC/Rec2 family competence protein [Marivirga sp.]|uniref:ComEC/Rec2 family competence protein n=1 Tax=Marivirga sp. TaxID=2018662 RepID=UPI002D7F0D8A|nr:ComEC/Rec2 family competence protein [Marivirga sp.]HET8858918.1 ComEC/Rec2 family competence protein [Marivirga sp.]
MQQAWNRYAFIRFVLFMSLGIVTGSFFPNMVEIIILIFGIITFLYFSAQFLKGYQFPTFQSVTFAVFAFLICFSFGFLNAYWKSEKHDETHLLNINASKVEAFEATLINAGKETAKTHGFKVEIEQVLMDKKWKNYSGKAMVYFQKDSLSKELKYGDQLLVKSRLTELEPPKNPLEFNYKRFLGFDQVYHQQYVPSRKWLKISEENGDLIISASIKTGQYLEDIMNENILNERSLAIAKALTLGIKDELDNELRNAYASAGAMHVLAVSGLHVGIIFLLISTLLKKWRNHKRGRYFFAIINISVLWTYAFITGLSPSVQRAAMMFSFIILAQAMKRQTNIYNTLAASAFVLLSFNPFLLFSVGFQLSYLAVLGIVFFQPKLYSLLQFKFILWDKLWAITCVSIAAQLATAPLGLLYFHQFPTYFFLSNLVVIPAAFVILNSSLFLLIISFWEWAAEWVGFLIGHFIQVINYLVFSLDYLPNSTIEGIFINTSESWFIYIAIFFIAIFISEKKLNYLKVTVFSLFLLSSSICWRQYQNFQEKKLIVYDTGEHHAISIRNGFSQYLKVDEELALDKNKLRFHVYPSQLEAGIADFHPDRFEPEIQNEIFRDFKGLKFAIWENKRIVHWHQEIKKDFTLQKPIEVDLLIISNNALQKYEKLLEFFNSKKIVLDASNSYYNIQNFKAKFEEENLDYYIVPEEGAFEWKL